MTRVVYHRSYNVGFFGLEKLHPFDSRKYGKAWRLLRPHVAKGDLVRPPQPLSRAELLEVHTDAYLRRLEDPAYLAGALEIPPLRLLPRWLIDWCVLRPMRWAAAGTIVAAREALAHGFAVNLGGGFHHAKPDAGEGFCVYNDIALAVRALRREGRLAERERVVYVDLDAHQGNGVSHAFLDERRVFMLDAFNSTIYPCYDTRARERIDCPLPLTPSCTETEYLGALRARLPGFLDSVGSSAPIGLAIYNAGTDVYEHDALGGLNVSARGIAERDAYVVSELRRRGLPTVMLLSGGYSPESYRIVGASIEALIRQEAARASAPQGAAC
jgi:histone deacetylase 11